MDAKKLEELKHLVEQCRANPSIIHDPSLAFFKSYLESMGARIPPPPENSGKDGKHFESAENLEPKKSNLSSNDALDEEIVESDVELDNADVVEPDNDPPQRMGDPLVEVTEENRDAAQMGKSKAMDAISAGNLNEAIDHLTEAVILNPTSAILYATRAGVFIKLNKPNAAICDADAALQINPDSAKGYKARGLARAMLGLWEEAANDLHVASKIDYDEEIGLALKKVEANVHKLQEHRRKYERLRKEKELKRIEREKQRQKAEAQAAAAAVLKDGEVIDIHSLHELEKKLDAASNTSRLAILYFTATWCGPCRFISPVYTSLAGKYAKVVFLKADIDETRDAAAHWNVSSVPTFFFIKNRKAVDKVVGADKSSLEKKIAELADMTTKQNSSLLSCTRKNKRKEEDTLTNVALHTSSEEVSLVKRSKKAQDCPPQILANRTTDLVLPSSETQAQDLSSVQPPNHQGRVAEPSSVQNEAAVTKIVTLFQQSFRDKDQIPYSLESAKEIAPISEIDTFGKLPMHLLMPDKKNKKGEIPIRGMDLLTALNEIMNRQCQVASYCKYAHTKAVDVYSIARELVHQSLSGDGISVVELRNTVESLKRQLGETEVKLKTAQVDREMARCALESRTAEINKYQKDLEKSHKDLEVSRHKLETTKKELAESRDQMESMKIQTDELSLRISKLNNDISEMSNSRSTWIEEYQKSKEYDDILMERCSDLYDRGLADGKYKMFKAIAARYPDLDLFELKPPSPPPEDCSSDGEDTPPTDDPAVSIIEVYAENIPPAPTTERPSDAIEKDPTVAASVVDEA